MILKFSNFFHVLNVICSFTFSFLLYEYKIVFVLSVHFYQFFFSPLFSFRMYCLFLKMRWKIQSQVILFHKKFNETHFFVLFCCSLSPTVWERKGSYIRFFHSYCLSLRMLYCCVFLYICILMWNKVDKAWSCLEFSDMLNCTMILESCMESRIALNKNRTTLH